MKKLTLLFVIVVLAYLSAACGGKGVNPIAPVGGNEITPTAEPTPFFTRTFSVALPGQPFGGQRTFSMPAVSTSGTLKIRVNWTFVENTLGVALLSDLGCRPVSGSNGAMNTSAEELLNGSCPTLIGPAHVVKGSTTMEFTRPVTPMSRASIAIINSFIDNISTESGTITVTLLP